MLFVGLDLGWVSGPSGLCALLLEGDELKLRDLRRVAQLSEVLDAVDQLVAGEQSAVIGVDAPLVIPNATGMRTPDRLAHRYFGRFHAGCYPANQGSSFAARLVGFSQALKDRGFVHGSEGIYRQKNRFQIEVFPHIATVQLFGLEKILKYKKGRLAARAAELRQLRQYLQTDLSDHTPRLVLSDLPEVPTTGRDLKALEDQLDAILCAYVAAYWWVWGTHRNVVLGSEAEGYMIVPVPPNAPVCQTDFR